MTNSNTLVFVCFIFLSLECCQNYSIIQIRDEFLIEDCVKRLIKILFGVEKTLIFIFENVTDIDFLTEVENPRIIVIISKPITVPFEMYYNYIIFAKDFNTLNETIEKLKISPVWRPSKSPRGKFLMFMFGDNYINETIEYFWRLDVTKLILVTKGDSDKVYKANPFDKQGKCVNSPKAESISPCYRINDLVFPSITTLNGCVINVVNTEDINDLVKQRKEVFTVGIKLFKLVADILKTNVTFQIVQDIKQTLYNRSKDIALYTHFIRLGDLYKDYEVTNYFMKDEIMWVVPKSPKISGYKIIPSLFERTLWTAIFVTFLTAVISLWVAARFISSQTTFQSLQRCFFTILVFTLDSGANILPDNNTMRMIVIFYLLYNIQISTVFHGKLISKLTEPGNEPSIKTIEDFSNLNFPIMAPNVTKQTMVKRVNGSAYKKIHNRIIVTEPFNMLSSVMDVAYHRNVSTFSSEFIINKVHPEIKRLVDVMNHNTGILPLECIVTMRKGHYFYDTFNTVIGRITESGFQVKMQSDLIEKKFMKQEGVDDNLDVVLTLAHLYSVFLLWIIGLIISIIVFVAEKLKKVL